MIPTDITEQAEKQVARGRHALKQSKAKLNHSADLMQHRLDDFADEARVYVDRAKSRLNTIGASALQTARDKPAVSALTILSVGVAVGAVLALALRSPAERLAHTALDEGRRLRGRFH